MSSSFTMRRVLICGWRRQCFAVALFKVNLEVRDRRAQGGGNSLFFSWRAFIVYSNSCGPRFILYFTSVNKVERKNLNSVRMVWASSTVTTLLPSCVCCAFSCVLHVRVSWSSTVLDVLCRPGGEAALIFSAATNIGGRRAAHASMRAFELCILAYWTCRMVGVGWVWVSPRRTLIGTARLEV